MRAASLGQAITDSILHLQGDELGVAQLRVGTTRPHGDTRTIGDHRFPGKFAHAGVQGIGVPRRHATYREINAPREPRPQAHPQGVFGAPKTMRRPDSGRTFFTPSPCSSSAKASRHRQARGKELINGLVHRAFTASLTIVLRISGSQNRVLGFWINVFRRFGDIYALICLQKKPRQQDMRI